MAEKSTITRGPFLEMDYTPDTPLDGPVCSQFGPVCQKTETQNVSSNILAEIVIKTHYLTYDPAHVLCVVGSTERLGHWQPTKSIPMTEASQKGFWQVSLELPQHEIIQWKLVVMDKRTSTVVRWEERDNRTLKLTEPVEIVAPWNYKEVIRKGYTGNGQNHTASSKLADQGTVKPKTKSESRVDAKQSAADTAYDWTKFADLVRSRASGNWLNPFGKKPRRKYNSLKYRMKAAMNTLRKRGPIIEEDTEIDKRRTDDDNDDDDWIIEPPLNFAEIVRAQGTGNWLTTFHSDLRDYKSLRYRMKMKNKLGQREPITEEEFEFSDKLIDEEDEEEDWVIEPPFNFAEIVRTQGTGNWLTTFNSDLKDKYNSLRYRMKRKNVLGRREPIIEQEYEYDEQSDETDESDDGNYYATLRDDDLHVDTMKDLAHTEQPRPSSFGDCDTYTEQNETPISHPAIYENGPQNPPVDLCSTDVDSMMVMYSYSAHEINQAQAAAVSNLTHERSSNPEQAHSAAVSNLTNEKLSNPEQAHSAAVSNLTNERLSNPEHASNDVYGTDVDEAFRHGLHTVEDREMTTDVDEVFVHGLHRVEDRTDVDDAFRHGLHRVEDREMATDLDEAFVRRLHRVEDHTDIDDAFRHGLHTVEDHTDVDDAFRHGLHRVEDREMATDLDEAFVRRLHRVEDRTDVDDAFRHGLHRVEDRTDVDDAFRHGLHRVEDREMATDLDEAFVRRLHRVEDHTDVDDAFMHGLHRVEESEMAPELMDGQDGSSASVPMATEQKDTSWFGRKVLFGGSIAAAMVAGAGFLYYKMKN